MSQDGGIRTRRSAFCSESHDHSVVHLMDEFERRNTPDEEWVPALGGRGPWVIISGDTRIFRSRHLREVWQQAKLTTFFLGKGWMNQKFWDQSWWLVRWWPRSLEQSALVERGTGFEVPAKPQGKFTLMR